MYAISLSGGPNENMELVQSRQCPMKTGGLKVKCKIK